MHHDIGEIAGAGELFKILARVDLAVIGIEIVTSLFCRVNNPNERYEG
ncbi:MAG: hypothetical protein ACYTFM_09490 [Planctomycetota bacterium]